MYKCPDCGSEKYFDRECTYIETYAGGGELIEAEIHDAEDYFTCSECLYYAPIGYFEKAYRKAHKEENNGRV